VLLSALKNRVSAPKRFHEDTARELASLKRWEEDEAKTLFAIARKDVDEQEKRLADLEANFGHFVIRYESG